jgi:hypothetical protein
MAFLLISTMSWADATSQPTALASPQVNPNQVTAVTGTVQLKKLSVGKAWDAAIASPLIEGEKVVTGPDSSSTLVLGDGSHITVGANSDFRLNQLPSSTAAAQLRLFKGQADIQIQNALTLQAGKNTYQTSASNFSLSYDSGIKKSHLTVASGSVTVSNAAQTQVFSEGQELVISGSKFKPVKTAAASAVATPVSTPKVAAQAVSTPVPAKVAAQAVVTPAPTGAAADVIAPNHGRVMTVIGGVQIVDDLTHQSQPAQVGADVTEQETIKTDVSSTVVLKFFDGSQLNVSPSTQLQLSSLKQLQGNDKILHFKLLWGDLIAKVTKLASSNSSFEIEGGGVVCGVRGTEFHPSYDPNQHLFTVDVIEGTVWVLSDGKTSVFTAGEHGRFTGNGNPGTGAPHFGSNTLPGLHDLTDGFNGGNHTNGDNGIKAIHQILGIHIIVP